MRQVVLVVGMPQSGSTLLYNIIMHLFAFTSPPNGPESVTADNAIRGVAAQDLLLRSPESEKGICVWKGHRRDLNCEMLIQHKNTKIFATRRDIRDCVASNVRRHRAQFTSFVALNESMREKYIRAYAANTLNAYNDWKNDADYEFIYEDYKNGDENHKISIVSSIAQILNLNLSTQKAKQNLHFVEEFLPDAIKEGHESYDPRLAEISMLDKYHITNQGIVGGYKDALSPNEIKAIEEVAGDWLHQKGYMI